MLEDQIRRSLALQKDIENYQAMSSQLSKSLANTINGLRVEASYRRFLKARGEKLVNLPPHSRQLQTEGQRPVANAKPESGDAEVLNLTSELLRSFQRPNTAVRTAPSIFSAPVPPSIQPRPYHGNIPCQSTFTDKAVGHVFRTRIETPDSDSCGTLHDERNEGRKFNTIDQIWPTVLLIPDDDDNSADRWETSPPAKLVEALWAILRDKVLIGDSYKAKSQKTPGTGVVCVYQYVISRQSESWDTEVGFRACNICSTVPRRKRFQFPTPCIIKKENLMGTSALVVLPLKVEDRVGYSWTDLEFWVNTKKDPEHKPDLDNYDLYENP